MENAGDEMRIYAWDVPQGDKHRDRDTRVKYLENFKVK